MLTSLAPASPAAKKNHYFRAAGSLRWADLLTAAAAIFLAVFFGMNKTAEYSEQTVLENAIQFFDAEDPAAQGHLLAEYDAARGIFV